jgi:hypothetical protein
MQPNPTYHVPSQPNTEQVIYDLKAFVSEQGARIGVLAKIESADSVHNLEEILDAVDGAMVARGDLGAELPVEDVPFWQNKIVQGCRKRGKPVIVATNMLESMIDNPTPTRAEVQCTVPIFFCGGCTRTPLSSWNGGGGAGSVGMLEMFRSDACLLYLQTGERHLNCSS